MPGRTKKRLESEPLDVAIPRIFEQVQSSTANHAKNFVALRKLHVEAAAEVKEIQKGRGLQLVGEAAFREAFLQATVRILPVKKGVAVADRVVRFIGGYIKHINKKADEEKKAEAGEDEDDTMETRFVSGLLEVLFKGFVAKDKSVRYRSVFLVAEMVAHMGELDEDLYQKLRSSLLDRVYDKETPVRVQAVIGLSKLCGSETEEDTAEGEQTATEVLVEIMSQDPFADVRRAVLCNIPVTSITLPAILERARDTDTTIRRLVFTLVLLAHAKNPNEDDKAEIETIGVAHPRALSIAQRELIVRHGLGDREENVRNAAAKVLRAWVDIAADPATNTGPGDIEQDLLAFLRMFDLATDQTAEDALVCVFTSRPEVLDALKFDDSFWISSMTPEKAFLIRVFTKYCVTQKEEAQLEGKLPVVTGFAFKIQDVYNNLRQRIESNMNLEDDEDTLTSREEARLDLEFVLGEMLRIAMYLDYGDEMGRRRMFQLVKDMISQESLPSELAPRCLDVLRKLTPNERELIRIVVEVVQDLRDLKEPDGEEDQEMNENADETVTSVGHSTRLRSSQTKQALEDMSPEERKRSDALDMRCLMLCIAMLERVNSTFEDNSTLQGLLRELIIPSVQRKELIFREKGLYCLALCCMIARRMARQSFGLFMSQVQVDKKTPESLKHRVLQAIFDIAMIHEQDFLDKGSDKYQEVVSFFMETLNHEDTTPQVEALVCVGLSKLVLSRMVIENPVLQSMVMVYVSPHTQDNQQLRQCLSYFFPVFCYSSAINQRQMQQLFIPIFELHQEKAEEDKEDMISPLQFAGMFVDWTDPNKAVDTDRQRVDPLIHFDMASDIMRALLGETLDRDYKKALCQILGRLTIPEKVDDDDRIRTLKLLMHHVQSKRPLRETAAKNALVKFDVMLSKKFGEQLKDFSEDDYRKLESLRSFFDFLDEIIPEDEEDEVPKRKVTRKRRSESVVSHASDDEAHSKGKRKPATRKGAKRRRVSSPGASASDSSAGSADESLRAPRNLPKRAVATKRPSLAEPELVDDDDDDDTSNSPAPPPRPRKSTTSQSKQPEEASDRGSDQEPEESVLDESEEELF